MSPVPTTGPRLPKPGRQRWQPLRSGLLNLYRFDREELWYEDGHLLLRGNNGTGKSRVLALQLPFLLDGEVASHRLEPDGDPAKRVEWNLLMGKHTERLGYTWLEFGRRNEADDATSVTDDADGDADDGETQAEYFFTLGCGLSAVTGRGRVERWFFITTLRIGETLSLEGSAGEALTRVRLVEALGENGEVFTSAAAYREAIDRKLFRLGKRRYGALLDLLIQLRRPQLSRKLNEEHLSRIFSEALPPLDASVLADVAESFRSLEADRHALGTLRSTADGVETFMEGYRRYARIATRRRAERVRTSHSAFEHAQRRLRQAERLCEQANLELEKLEHARHGLSVEIEAAAAEVKVLEARPEVRGRHALEMARETAAERRRDVTRSAEQRDRAALIRQRAEDEAKQAEHATREAEAGAAKHLERIARDAEAIALERPHSREIEGLGFPDLRPEAVNAAEQRLEDLAGERQRAVEHLRRLATAVETAERALTAAKERQTERAADLDRAIERQRQAADAVERAMESLLEGYAAWQRQSKELRLPSAGEIDEGLRTWAESLDGENPIFAALRSAETDAGTRIATEQAEHQVRLGVVETGLAVLRNERQELLGGALRPPPVPATRDPGGRARRRGAPLWRVCDFAPGLDRDQQSGIEAALEAAGLLDAWLSPAGDMLEAGDHDTVLIAAGSPPAPSGRGIDQVLQPAAGGDDLGISADAVLNVLRAVGFGEASGEIWVTADGRFKLGPLRGSSAKPVPQHIGAEARAAERQRRLGEIEVEIHEAESRLDDLLAKIATLDERCGAVRDQVAAVPSDDDLRRAVAALGAMGEPVEQARERLVEAEATTRQQRTERDRVATSRDQAASDLGLSDRLGELESLRETIDAYRRRLAALWPQLRACIDHRRAAVEATWRAEESGAELERGKRRLTEAERAQRAAEAECNALVRVQDQAATEILAQLGAARASVEQAERSREKAIADREEHIAHRAQASQQIENETENLGHRNTERGKAIEGLAQLLSAGLSAIALDALEAEVEPPRWDAGEVSVRSAVARARQLETALATLEVDATDAAWERQRDRVHAHFQSLVNTLSADGYQPTMSLEHGLFIASVPFQGRQASMAAFRTALSQEIEARDRVLAEREREVIENHLIGEVSLHLQNRLREAEDLVLRINQQIERRPTSTGMTLRFRWRPRADELRGLGDARSLLMAEPGTWSPDDRTALGTFLHELIRQPEESRGGLLDHLSQVLDYRAWHEFLVERRQDGQWRRLTRRSHGTGSGGEKAIALSLPQFAAAAAYYDTAENEHAPRLILLDEAFVGVDPDMRSKCMGLLQDFDLDFVMTSEVEWGCYPTLSGLAIYQLATRPGIDAIGLSRWHWNGRERRLAPHPAPQPAFRLASIENVAEDAAGQRPDLLFESDT